MSGPTGITSQITFCNQALLVNSGPVAVVKAVHVVISVFLKKKITPRH
jgi:hypothetical protein